MPNTDRNPKNQENQTANILSLKFWTSIIKELGLATFVVFFFTMIFLYFGTKEQKRAFIDEFFLLRDVNKNPFPFSFVVLALILIVFVQYFYYNKIIKELEKENDRLDQVLEQLKGNKKSRKGKD